MSSYLKSNDEAAGKYILGKLKSWAENNEKLGTHFADSMAIGKILQQSVNLSEAAKIGIEAMSLIKEKANPDEGWKKSSLDKLALMKKAVAQTELDILPEIESLVKQEMVALPSVYPMF